jgi:polar amino acid transport system substrate-binding protein
MASFHRKRGVWRILAATVAIVAVGASSPAAKADDISGLDGIIKRGTVHVAIDLSSPPFGLQDENMQPAGADVDTAKLLAADLGVKLDIVQVNSANRVPYLLTKRVDFVISSFTITPDRAKSVTFSIPYGGMDEVLTARRGEHITGPADLAGKKIAVARGTTNELDAVAIAPPTAQVIRFDDEASAQSALVSGQVDGYVTGEIITKALAKRNPTLELETKFPLRTNYFAVGMRRGDADMARWVDIWVMSHKSDGALAKIFDHWVGHAATNLPVF